MRLDPASIVRRRLHAQRLTGEPFATPAEAVAWSGAVQAQEHAEALWSLGTRVRDHDEAAVQAACDRGEIIRTHVLRPTWHFVAAADLRWMLRLTGPRVQAKNAGRLHALGLDEHTLAHVHDALASTLADGRPRTRRELGAALEAAGIDSGGQRIAHAVMHAELGGVLCSGPRRGHHHTYVALDGRVPPAPARDRDADVAELATRYFTSHGPATLRDFAWWSGLTIADGRAGVAAAGDVLDGAPDDRGTLWISAASGARPAIATTSDADARPGVATTSDAGARPGVATASDADARPGVTPPRALLVGTYDELLVAYRDLRTVHADGGPGPDALQRTILVDGRAAGRWRRRLGAREVVVEIELDAPPAPPQRAALHAEVERFGAFVGLPARLVGAAHERPTADATGIGVGE